MEEQSDGQVEVERKEGTSEEEGKEESSKEIKLGEER